jgi:hypothetical protein
VLHFATPSQQSKKNKHLRDKLSKIVEVFAVVVVPFIVFAIVILSATDCLLIDNFGRFVLAINRGQQDIHHGTSKAAPKVGGKAPDFDSLPLGTAYPITANDTSRSEGLNPSVEGASSTSPNNFNTRQVR